MNLAAEAENYRQALQDFVVLNDLPRHWFDRHDHIAFKAYNPKDYESLVDRFRPMSAQITETYIDDRRIATAHLLGECSINMTLSFSPMQSFVNMVELMEARPEDQSDEKARLDHEEIYFPNGIIPIRSVLRRKRIEYFDQENRSHSWISVIINEDALELKFTDKTLADIVQDGLDKGEARVL